MIPTLISNLHDSIKSSNLNGDGILVRSYIASLESRKIYKEFNNYGKEYTIKLKYPRIPESPHRQGDLFVLKPYLGKQEKGTLLIQYTESIRKFVSLYDAAKILEDYRIVLEPSWWGYQDINFFLLFGHGGDIIVEAQYSPDYNYIESLRSPNIHAIPVGAGDWCDPEMFCERPGVGKEFDIVMVANWGRIKRHIILFEAVSKMRDLKPQIALIGFPKPGRSSKDIMSEARRFNVEKYIHIFENIPPEKVSEVIQKSKINVMLTKGEGANRGIYESFFCNVPVLLTSENKGVNRSHINELTGYIASDKDLPYRLERMIKTYKNYHPREWALANTGYKNSTAKLNSKLKEISEKYHETWSANIFYKKNVPNARYEYEDEQMKANTEFMRLKEYLR
jgi:glycosyltransferase involved in cell wall biosynthesis